MPKVLNTVHKARTCTGENRTFLPIYVFMLKLLKPYPRQSWTKQNTSIVCRTLIFIFFSIFFRIAVEKLHKMDNAFRKQLESVLAAHQKELLHLENEKEKQIEAANEKVILILNSYIYCICIFILQLLKEWCLEVSCLNLSGWLWMETLLV